MSDRGPLLADLAADLAALRHPFRFIAHGTSMAPAIPSGSELLVEPCSRAALSPGQVAVVRSPRGLLVHRVVRVGGAWMLQGDALEGPDGPLDSFDVIGRVAGVRKRARVRRLIRRMLGAFW